ncbi:MAG: tetratricopeptide repeat protein [Opitutales bacterium]
MSALLETYGPVFDELLSRPFAWPGEPGPETGPLLRLSRDEAFEHHALAEPALADACVAGVYLRVGRWDDAFKHLDGDDSREAHYWRGIAHRLQRDRAAAIGAFEKVGDHPIHPALLEAAGPEAGMSPFNEWERWQPGVFIELFTESAGTDSDLERACRHVHAVEWRLLFDYSYRGAIGAPPPPR